ncbi:MAG: helix-turn-helix transcriptional regulator [Candidatus Devosia phytovorans]|uniref:Helix-turn-helix transcriptional regulator n=1 Tax=Candidatus Devosia phytovorans TaxID=3121372 RepID=A0AAJ6AYX1_9HYPH|nr:helix-turn-helix transcriptional regulator [Devosia sp.]WEK04055.1 MAG: helix-turn-helix transcriptional regulator [Devosia sp.]
MATTHFSVEAMPDIRLETLGAKVKQTRGAKGIRAAAEEIGVSTATLSRIENGHLPDLETFRRVCGWLGADPSTVLGFEPSAKATPVTMVHFKKKKTQSQDTLRALGEMIAAAQLALEAE